MKTDHNVVQLRADYAITFNQLQVMHSILKRAYQRAIWAHDVAVSTSKLTHDALSDAYGALEEFEGHLKKYEERNRLPVHEKFEFKTIKPEDDGGSAA